MSGERLVGPVPAGRDPDAYDRVRRRVLWSLPTGLYVIGSRASENGSSALNLMTANLLTQVATDPKLVAVSIESTARTCELVRAGGAFSVSVLDRGDRAVVRRFVKPVTDVALGPDGVVEAMAGEPVVVGVTGAPVLARAIAWLDCAVAHECPLGSHVLFVGEVVDAGGRGVEAEGGGEGGSEPGAGEGARGRLEGVLRMEDTRMNYGG